MNRPHRRFLTSAAARWFVRARSEPDVDKTAFFRWLRSDPRALEEYDAVEGIWDGLDALRGDPDLEREMSAPAPARPDRRHVLAAGGLAAAAVGGLTIASFYTPRGAAYETGRGERRDVTLADGSVVSLNARSRAIARIGAGVRDVALLEGEAFFAVTRHAGLRFTVEAGGLRLVVLGTAFNVQLTPLGLRLDVAEGLVRLDGPAPVLFRAGEGAHIARNGTIRRLFAVDGRRAMAWRSGALDLAATPLRDAVVALNRYAERPLVLADPRLGDVQVSGVFKLEEADSFARALEALRLARVEMRPDSIVLHPPARPAQP